MSDSWVSKKQFTLRTLNDVNIVGAGLKNLDQFAQMFAFLRVDRQANQLVVVVHAWRKRRGRLGLDLDELIAVGVRVGALVTIGQADDQLATVEANAGQRMGLGRFAQVDDLMLGQVLWKIRQGREQKFAAHAVGAEDAAHGQEVVSRRGVQMNVPNPRFRVGRAWPGGRR